jgi:hypothetical protein
MPAKIDRGAIGKWMRANLERFRDKRTGEVNTTLLVETWDIECATGSDTLDPNHVAWDLVLMLKHLDKLSPRGV